jgi:uncharacterized protein
MRRLSVRALLPLIAVAALAAGCAQQSQPSTFYVLSYPQTAGQSGLTTTMRQGLAVGVGPVELPQYLDRPQIVTRTTDNQLRIEEFDRWGGRLKENFSTVLAEVLSAELETDRITAHPWASAAPIEFQVIVNVITFDTDTAGLSRLDARWSIVNVRRQEVLATARSAFRQQVAESPDPESPLESVDYDAIAVAMSRNVADLAQEIARQIRSYPSS